MPLSSTKEKEALTSDAKNLTLCLSGGGLRATFFHLGVIQNLRDHDQLKNIKQIYSVSGGSILAAHMVLNWEKYLGSEKQFKEVVQELQDFGLSDARGQVIRRSILSWITPVRIINYIRLLQPSAFFKKIPQIGNRTDFLIKQYKNIFHHAKLSDLRTAHTKKNAPKLYILSTSFSTGELCSFSGDGYNQNLGNPKSASHQADFFSVQRAVAASSAFPGLFPPMKLTRETLNLSEAEFSQMQDFLSDGGVYDNLGIDTILEQPQIVKDQLVIVSDASSPFDWKIQNPFSFFVSSATRATDILMKRISDILLEKSLKIIKEDSLIHISILNMGTIEEPDRMPKAHSAQITKFRTDLDRFELIEQKYLRLHGWEVSETSLPDLLKVKNVVIPKDLECDHSEENAKTLRCSADRKFRLWSHRDRISYLSTVWVCFLAYAFIGYPYQLYQNKTKKLVKIETKLDTSDSKVAKLTKKIDRIKPVTVSFTLNRTGHGSSNGSASLTKKDAKIFLQFFGYKRSTLRGLASDLVGKDWNVPVYEVGGERIREAKNKAEVRYNGDGYKKLAEELANDIRLSGVNKKVKAVKNKLIKPGILEVWIGQK